MEEEVSKALEDAKKLEEHKLKSKRQIEQIYRHGMKEAATLQGLLKPVWFLSAPRKRKVYKSKRVPKPRR